MLGVNSIPEGEAYIPPFLSEMINGWSSGVIFMEGC
jgi:hypothetical protein